MQETPPFGLAENATGHFMRCIGTSNGVWRLHDLTSLGRPYILKMADRLLKKLLWINWVGLYWG